MRTTLTTVHADNIDYSINMYVTKPCLLSTSSSRLFITQSLRQCNLLASLLLCRHPLLLCVPVADSYVALKQRMNEALLSSAGSCLICYNVVKKSDPVSRFSLFIAHIFIPMKTIITNWSKELRLSPLASWGHAKCCVFD